MTASFNLFPAALPVPVGSRWKNVLTGDVMQVLAVEDSTSAPSELRRYAYDQSQYFHRAGTECEYSDNIERRFVRLDDGATEEEIAAAIKERLATRKNRDVAGYSGPGAWASRNLERKALAKLEKARLLIGSFDEWNDLRVLMVQNAELAAMRRYSQGLFDELHKVLKEVHRLRVDNAEAGTWAYNRECPSCKQARSGALSADDVAGIVERVEAAVGAQEKPPR